MTSLEAARTNARHDNSGSPCGMMKAVETVFFSVRCWKLYTHHVVSPHAAHTAVITAYSIVRQDRKASPRPFVVRCNLRMYTNIYISNWHLFCMSVQDTPRTCETHKLRQILRKSGREREMREGKEPIEPRRVMQAFLILPFIARLLHPFFKVVCFSLYYYYYSRENV